MENIIEILKKWNPWEKEVETGIKRKSYIKKIYPYLERKEVIVLKGIRRSGKSTIVKQLINELINEGISKKQILYLNLEEYNFANNLTIELFEEVLKAYKEYSKNKNRIYFFIDEIQKIPSWEKWIRTKYDLNENIKFIITGSSASLLSKELSTLLTGRNISFIIMPLSFNEFIKFKKEENMEEYMKFGGFPEIVLEKSEEKKTTILQQYFEDIVHKDIIDRYKIRNTKLIMDLARYLVSASGAKLSINKLSKVFGVAKDTLQTYINYMIDAYLLFEVTYFSYSAKIKHDISKLPKIYCLDNGFINITNIKYAKNLGQMFENTAFIKLAEKHKEISYWGELTSEVDFIAEKNAINITATDKISDREFKGLEDFQKKHKGFTPIIISHTLKKDNIMPIKEFLKQEE
jgi:hypothetical protein